jgi:hypothetical protein
VGLLAMELDYSNSYVYSLRHCSYRRFAAVALDLLKQIAQLNNQISTVQLYRVAQSHMA